MFWLGEFWFGDIIYKKVEEIVKQKENKVTSVVNYKQYTNTINYVPAVYSEVTGNAVVEYAKRYLGLRYVSGGYSLSTGTDCSGFTKLIYQEFGVVLSRSVKAQAYNGTFVSKSDLQKGDLVFYANGDWQICHVGIYIGNGLVLHQSNPRDGVKITTVNMMQYVTARRVINSTAIKIVEDRISQEESNKVIEGEVSNTDNETNNEVEENNNVDNNTNLENVSEELSTNKDVLEEVVEEKTTTQEETVKEESIVINQENVTDNDNQE